MSANQPNRLIIESQYHLSIHVYVSSTHFTSCSFVASVDKDKDRVQ